MIAVDQHLVLVGMTGVGKSTIARIVAVRLGRKVVDTDTEIERRAGKSVRRIFAEDGEPAFRALESQVLVEVLAARPSAVIATGGGVVVTEGNRVALRESGARVVWLAAEVATLLDRVQRGSHRPLLDDDPAGTLQRMVRDREPWYREVADAIVLVDSRSVSEVVEAILR